MDTYQEMVPLVPQPSPSVGTHTHAQQTLDNRPTGHYVILLNVAIPKMRILYRVSSWLTTLCFQPKDHSLHHLESTEREGEGERVEGTR